MNVPHENLEITMTYIVAPILAFLGVLVGYYGNKYKTNSEAFKLQAEAAKISAEKEKIAAETNALELQIKADTINYYVGIVNSLRDEVKVQSERINLLVKKQEESEIEKLRLRKENEELNFKVNKQQEEIISLNEEVAKLKKRTERREGGDRGE